ncbi:viral late transcription elongation factor [Pteropox virus]|uniref:Late transcription elongation factor OPG087 n=1 Tax=Pteropox virus TaxID=1873698 RepID=A0A1B1MRC2_9POXV|nr:viral late transcription elongation factor [Pteropox virus]ANS71141.1 viral late transcription elongation factor [Pteropox virus]
MSFRELILFNVLKFIIMSDTKSLKTLASLSLAFGSDIVEKNLSKFNKRYYKHILQITQCTEYVPILDLEFDSDVIREIIKLRLLSFNHTIKPLSKLKLTMKGVITVSRNKVYIYDANDELLEMVMKQYNPSMYNYISSKKPKVIKGSNILVCGFPKISYFAYSISKIYVNVPTTVVVTDTCISTLLKDKHCDILKNIFNNGSGVLNESFKQLFYFLYDQSP